MTAKFRQSQETSTYNFPTLVAFYEGKAGAGVEPAILAGVIHVAHCYTFFLVIANSFLTFLKASLQWPTLAAGDASGAP